MRSLTDSETGALVTTVAVVGTLFAIGQVASCTRDVAKIEADARPQCIAMGGRWDHQVTPDDQPSHCVFEKAKP